MKLLGSVNNAIKLLIFSSVTVNMADGVWSPVFAIYVTQKIAPGNLSAVGYAIAIYWLVKSILQLPLARFLDKTDGERDDYIALIIGGVIYVIAPLLYFFVDHLWQLFVLQAVYAVAGSLYVVPWSSIFTRHVDKFRIGFEWSLNSSALGFGLMISTAVGGYIAQNLGFGVIFLISSSLNLMGLIGMLLLKKHITQRNRLEKAFHEQHHRHSK